MKFKLGNSLHVAARVEIPPMPESMNNIFIIISYEMLFFCVKKEQASCSFLFDLANIDFCSCFDYQEHNYCNDCDTRYNKCDGGKI